MPVASADGVEIVPGLAVNLLAEDDEPSAIDAVVVSCDPETELCVVCTPDGEQRSIGGRRLRPIGTRRVSREEDAQLLAMLRTSGPGFIRFLAEQTTPELRVPSDMLVHTFVEQLEDWATDVDLAPFLAYPDRLERLARSVAQLALQVAATVKKWARAQGRCTGVLPCVGCNTPFDSGGCAHEGQPDKRKLPSKSGEMHTLSVLMALATRLLTWPLGPSSTELAAGQHALSILFVSDPPKGCATKAEQLAWIAACHASQAERHKASAAVLIELIDACSLTLPKVANHAAALLSVLLSRRPAVALSGLDATKAQTVLTKYNRQIFERVTCPCIVEQRFGVIHLLTVLPVMYHLGDWVEAKSVLSRSDLAASLVTLAINLLHELDHGDGSDLPPDDRIFPEFKLLGIESRALYGGAQPLLRRRPQSCAIAATFEAVGRWQHRGVDVSGALIPCRPPPAVAAQLSRAEIANYGERVSECVTEYLPHLRRLVKRVPEIAYALPLAEAIAEGRRPPLLDEGQGALLRFSLHAGMTCALPTCARTTRVAADGGDGAGTGEPLNRCAGGCKGLARYCCKEHQREHWPVHKHFCKR